MMYRLIALDLDGTLLDDQQHVSARVRQAIAAAQRRGVHVTLATGRGYPSTLPFAQDLHIAEPLLCYQGGMVVCPDGRVLHRVCLQRALATQVLTLARDHGWHAAVYSDGAVYVDEQRHPWAFYEAWIAPDVRVASDWRAVLASDPDKVLLIADDAGQADIMDAEMHRQFSDRMRIVRSHALFVEANSPGVDKGAGLAWLANHLDVPVAQVMAVGDQDNDAPMLAWAGLGVAMGNASLACKAAADWIAPGLQEDGAAIALERFALEGWVEP